MTERIYHEGVAYGNSPVFHEGQAYTEAYHEGTRVWQMFAGISNVQFGGVTSAVNLSSHTSFDDVVSVDITPTATDRLIGILQATAVSSGSADDAIIKMVRGSTDITHASAAAPHFRRQLFLDKPNATSQQTYKFQARRRLPSHTSAAIEPGASLTLFEFPDNVRAGIVTSSVSVSSAWTDVMSVSVTPTSTSEKVRLQFLVIGRTELTDLRLNRGATTLITVTTEGAILDVTSPEEDISFPQNWEDWVDSPASTSAQTYTIQARQSGGETVQIGSFILAEPVE